MSTTGFWLTLVAASIATFLLRWCFIALSGVLELPAPIRRALRFVPAAVLSAIILPAVLVRHDQILLTAGNLRLFAALVAAVVAWYTRSILYTIIVGMAVLWGLTALQPLL